MSAAKTLKAKMDEAAAARAKLAELESAVAESRESVVESVRDLFDDGMLDTLRAMAVKRIVVDIGEDGAKVALQAGASGNGGNGNGAKAQLYWSEYQSGQTISQIAKAHGVKPATVGAMIKPLRQASGE